MTTQCPQCHATIEPVPMVYGYPTIETMQEADAGRLRLGGCLMDAESPEFECSACGEALPFASKPRRQRRRRTVAPMDTDPAS